MKKSIKEETKKEFEGYEDARVSKDGEKAQTATPKAVKAATNRINPDENTQDRG